MTLDDSIHRRRLERYGLDGVHPRRQQARRGRPSPLSPPICRAPLCEPQPDPCDSLL